MFFQLSLGTLLLILTIVVEVFFIDFAIKGLTHFGPRLSKSKSAFGFIIALTCTALWLLAALTVATWLWAITFVILGVFETLELALYFSMVSFTTLGYGDVTLPVDIRLLSGFIAANGLVLFGLNTAFLIEVMARFRGENT